MIKNKLVTAYESTHSLTDTWSEPPSFPTVWELTVSCSISGSSISLPDGDSFHHFFTVLLRYRSPRNI